MGIRFTCPNGHKLHVKAFLAGKRGVCPKCGTKVIIPIVPESIDVVASPANGADQAPSRDALAFGSVGTSTIIAVSDSPAKSVATASPAVPATDLPPLEILPDEPVAAPPPGPRIVDEIATSPADRYVAQRERSRRRQVNTAILLLISVIVLACVLILVLKFNSGASPATTSMQINDPVLRTVVERPDLNPIHLNC